MKRLAIALATLSIFSVAQASNPHFIYANGVLNTTTGDYVASFKEAGLGKNQNVQYLLEADANFVFQCYTKSNNQPQGAPNAGGSGHLSEPGTFNSGKNGNIVASLTLSPEVGDASCQGNGLKLCLNSVSYQNVTLKDNTNEGVPVQHLPSASTTFSEPICGF